MVADFDILHVGIAFSHELGDKTTVMSYALGKNPWFYFS